MVTYVFLFNLRSPIAYPTYVYNSIFLLYADMDFAIRTFKI